VPLSALHTDDAHTLLQALRKSNPKSTRAWILPRGHENFGRLPTNSKSSFRTGDPKHPEITPGARRLQHASDALAPHGCRADFPYKRIEGEGAFYKRPNSTSANHAIAAPALTTVHSISISPRAFAAYVGEEARKHQPLMVPARCGGSVERFFGS